MQPPPGALELLEIRLVNDLVDLIAQLAVELRDDGLDVGDGVARREARALERLFGERADGALHLRARAIRLRLELLVEQGCEIAALGFGGRRLRSFALFLLFGHGTVTGLSENRHPLVRGRPRLVWGRRQESSEDRGLSGGER